MAAYFGGGHPLSAILGGGGIHPPLVPGPTPGPIGPITVNDGGGVPQPYAGGGVPQPAGGGNPPPYTGGGAPQPIHGIHWFGPGGHGIIPTPAPAPAPSAPAPAGSLASWLQTVSGAANPAQVAQMESGLHGDEGTVSNVAQHLMSALGAARDPNLRESLSTALAAIHKHIAGFQKERHQALQGKFSPRLMEAAQAARGPAHVLANQGHYAQAAQMWEQHHPYAVTHGQIPGYVSQWIQQAQNPQAYTNAPAGTATAY